MYSASTTSRNMLPFAMQFGTNREYDINLNFRFQVDTPTEQSYACGEIGPTRFYRMQPGQSYYFFQSNIQQQDYGQRTPSVVHPSSSSGVMRETSRPSLFSGQTPTPPATSFSNQRDFSTPLNNENLRIKQDSRKFTSSPNQFGSGMDITKTSIGSLNSFCIGPSMTSTPFNSRRSHSPIFGNGQLQPPSPCNSQDTFCNPPLTIPTQGEHSSFDNYSCSSVEIVRQNASGCGCNFL
ncbi:unnamed protein product [Orchesella dallaii]|uniref:Uncharacterized protein n=1 Tax=Orchesella dallaii TaxID=48710 RepID=A0ABP1RBR3_9HEXA